jgi:hypothetical protein
VVAPVGRVRHPGTLKGKRTDRRRPDPGRHKASPYGIVRGQTNRRRHPGIEEAEKKVHELGR